MESELLGNDIETEHGFPFPNWNAIWERSLELAEEKRPAFWRAAAEAWLTLISKSLGPESTVHSSERILLVSVSPEDQGELLLKWSNRALLQIEAMLGDTRSAERFGPRVIVLLPDTERLYDYVSRFDPEGEFGGIGGVALTFGGYIHVVAGPGSPTERQAIIAHELTHLCVHGRGLPLWLEEGLAQEVEETLLRQSTFRIDRDLRDRHVKHWGRHGLQGFWSGESFSMPDDHQELSYHLAQLLVRNLVSTHGKRLQAFFEQARFDDAGDGAARQLLGCGVASFAAEFLGEGNWEPRPELWSASEEAALDTKKKEPPARE